MYDAFRHLLHRLEALDGLKRGTLMLLSRNLGQVSNLLLFIMLLVQILSLLKYTGWGLFLGFAVEILGLELCGEPALDYMSLEDILAVVVYAADLALEGPGPSVDVHVTLQVSRGRK